MKKRIFLVLFIIIPQLSFALEEQDSSHFPVNTFSFFFENDTFFGTDREYTNGLRMSLIYSKLPESKYFFENFYESLVTKTGLKKDKKTRLAYSFSFGQNIYTPEDTTTSELVKEDRPYAGLSYISSGVITQSDQIMNSIDFAIGLVGPLSYGEDTQNYIHETFNWAKPKGWKHQLKDEPIFQTFYSRRWKAAHEVVHGFGFDLIPEVAGGVGNALTYVQAGLSFRAGYNIPNDFGTPRIRPATETNFPLDKNDPRLYPKFKRYGIYIFCTANSEYTLRNIFLDGNTFSKSHSVNKFPITGTTTIGLGLIIHRFNLVYGEVFNSKAYEEQGDRQSYGTLSISYSW